MNNSWYHLFGRYKKDILRQKGRLVMLVSRHCQDLTWITHSLSSHDVLLAWLFQIQWWSKRRFCLFKIIKPTNRDIKDAACLHVVHILQHPTSRPILRSTHDDMVYPLKKILAPLPGGKYGKWTKQFTRQCHQANTGNSGLEAERIRAVGPLRSLGSKKKLSAEKRWQTHF